MTQTLHDIVLDRLDREARAEAEAPPRRGRPTTFKMPDWDYLVLAALEGEKAVEDALSRDAPLPRAAPADGAAAAPRPAGERPGAYVQSITVQGFRGIGPRKTLRLKPGPGLTVVTGRNGSGKSSFAEALELLLTRTSQRWEGRSSLWKTGWRNLHHGPPVIEAELLLDGVSGQATVARQWSPTDDLEAAPPATLQPHGKPRGRLSDLGWDGPLQMYRPFLSYSELGALLDGRNVDLHDALVAILGLDQLKVASDALKLARSRRDSREKEAGKVRDGILAALVELDDERARSVQAALERKDWGLDEITSLLAGSAAPAAPDSVLNLLQQLSGLQAPQTDAVEAIVVALSEADAGLKRTTGTLAARSRDLAAVLDHALRFHETYGDGTCPVCGRAGALDAAWHQQQRDQMLRLRGAAQEASDAQQAVDQARRSARALPLPAEGLLARSTEAGLDPTPALTARQALVEALADDDLAALADSLGDKTSRFREAVDALRTQAEEERRRREDRWRPLAVRLTDWLPKAKEALRAASAVPRLQAAEKWLAGTTDSIRQERFAPVKERAQSLWAQLRLESNVDLTDVRLSGSANKRHVDLDVAVDGQDGAALGVMSQGELHALALSLFIPRATQPESPFRFLVVDDPVQSMDPARVDGLARVLHEVARTRQVIVFTHDDRLPESLRRLALGAIVIEVTRRAGSEVDTRVARDPVSRAIEDALAVANSKDIPAAAARRVVPGLCRHAVEAACTEVVRRRRLRKGERHAAVEDLLAGCTGSKSLLALLLFDDVDRTSDVMARLNTVKPAYADVFRAVNEGAHELQDGAMRDTVKQAEKLAQWIQGQS